MTDSALTAPSLQKHGATVYHGDSLDVLRSMPDNSVDSIVTDPPYGLAPLPQKKIVEALTKWVTGDRSFTPGGKGFMGNNWDRFVPPPALWDEALRVLKPGGYLLSFAGARTQDLMGMSLRLAGFRMLDGLQWLRADSFAKTKYALKPGYEPILFAQKPLDGTIEQNIAKWGTGGTNVEELRIAFRNAADEAETKGKNQHGKYKTKQGGNSVYSDYSMIADRTDYDPEGRAASNVLLDEAVAEQLDAVNQVTRSRKGPPRSGAAGDGWRMTASGAEYDDIGGPSRFYQVFTEDADPFVYAGRAPSKERPVGDDGFKHDTVKPLKVMDWCVRLVTPAGGVVLDMFAGSGTTIEAAINAGYQAIGVETDGRSIGLIRKRIERATPPAL